MQRATRSVRAFAVCFAVGASLSLFFGQDARNWFPVGIVVSGLVAVMAFKR